MSINQTFLAELKHEAANTKNLLQAVPLEKATWKPHEKSMSLKDLSIHVAEIFTWIHDILDFSELDFITYVQKPRTIENNQDLLTFLDENVNQGIATLEKITDNTFSENWTMRNGEIIYFTLPKIQAIRTWVFNHLYHHRGQLTVYLRLLDVKVPGMFGPTADDSSM